MVPKFIGVLVAVSVLAASVLIVAPAQAATFSVTENSITFLLDDVTHTATATDYDVSGPKDVVIPNSVTDDEDVAYAVTAISSNAFKEKGLVSVVIPSTVTSIGAGAFRANPSLVSVIFSGPAPTTITSAEGTGPSLGSAVGLTVHYLAQFGVDRVVGGFTSPTWQGYNTVVVPIVSFELNGHGDAVARAVGAPGWIRARGAPENRLRHPLTGPGG